MAFCTNKTVLLTPSYELNIIIRKIFLYLDSLRVAYYLGMGSSINQEKHALQELMEHHK